MARTNGGTPRARALGAELRQAREERGVGVRELARRLGTDHSKLSRYESGQTAVPAPEYVASILTALGASEEERERIVEMARGANGSNWLTPGVPGVQHELTTLIEFERDAHSIYEIATLVLPGLLQTSAYTRAVMLGAERDEVEARVALRMGRQERLTSEDAPVFTALVLESALRNPVGGWDVLSGQLDHLLKVAERSNVVVRAIPWTLGVWHPAHAGAYILFEFPKAAPIVHIEQYSLSAFLHDQQDVRAYREATSKLQQLALGETESRQLIATIRDEVEDYR